MPMQPEENVLIIVANTLGSVFSLWPIVLLSVLVSRRGPLLRGALIMWAVFLISWICARLLDVAPYIPLIPEPWSTIGFFAVGILLGVLLVVARLRG